MPLYEYLCKKCGHRFEKLRMFSDKPIKKCPECGGAVEQLISASSVQFKGSGWYVTDYGGKGKAGGGESAKPAAAPSEAAPAAPATTAGTPATPSAGGCGSGGCSSH